MKNIDRIKNLDSLDICKLIKSKVDVLKVSYDLERDDIKKAINLGERQALLDMLSFLMEEVNDEQLCCISPPQ